MSPSEDRPLRSWSFFRSATRIAGQRVLKEFGWGWSGPRAHLHLPSCFPIVASPHALCRSGPRQCRSSSPQFCLDVEGRLLEWRRAFERAAAASVGMLRGVVRGWPASRSPGPCGRLQRGSGPQSDGPPMRKQQPRFDKRRSAGTPGKKPPRSITSGNIDLRVRSRWGDQHCPRTPSFVVTVHERRAGLIR